MLPSDNAYQRLSTLVIDFIDGDAASMDVSVVCTSSRNMYFHCSIFEFLDIHADAVWQL